MDQFQRFMSVIKKLGDRVQREHDQFLRDSQRIEDRSAIAVNGPTTPSLGGGVNFEDLVGRGDGVTVKPDTIIDSAKGWDEDDVWGSIFSNEVSIFFRPRYYYPPCELYRTHQRRLCLRRPAFSSQCHCQLPQWLRLCRTPRETTLFVRGTVF